MFILEVKTTVLSLLVGHFTFQINTDAY